MRGWQSSLVLGYSLTTIVLHRHQYWVTDPYGAVQRSLLGVKSVHAQTELRFSYQLFKKSALFYLRILSAGLLIVLESTIQIATVLKLYINCGLVHCTHINWILLPSSTMPLLFNFHIFILLLQGGKRPMLRDTQVIFLSPSPSTPLQRPPAEIPHFVTITLSSF